MSNQVGSVSGTNSASSTSAASSSSNSSVPKLSEDTKKKLQDLGVDTTGITSEAQGQIALLQAQQAQQAQGGEKSKMGDKAEMETLKSEATSLAAKLGISVSSDEKLPDIIAAIGPAVESKASSAGTDQAKISEAQELQSEYNSISSSLSNMEAQQAQSAQASKSESGSQAISSTLNNMATQNKIYHKV